MFKYSFCLLISLAVLMSLPAQTLQLQECRALARKFYPLTQQYALIEQSGRFSIDNAAKAWLPQLSFSGQASYQSEVVEFPKIGPTAAFPTLSKDQYKVSGELTQLIYDGAGTRNQKALLLVDQQIQTARLDQSLYALDERVDQLFFGILLQQEQLKQNDLLITDIEAGIRQTTGALENGTVFRSALDELKAAMLLSRQNRIAILANRDAYLKMLGAFIQKDLDSNTMLSLPAPVTITDSIHRPEQKLFSLTRQRSLVQEKSLQARSLPTVSAYFNAAYGRPTFNFISNDFGTFWIGGIRFAWNIGKQYTNKKEKQILGLSRQQTDAEEAAFLFNSALQLEQDKGAIRQYREQMANDQEIISLRTAVKQAAAAQLENGVITAHDYLLHVNEDNQARLNLSIHQVYLLKSIYQSQYHSGSQTN